MRAELLPGISEQRGEQVVYARGDVLTALGFQACKRCLPAEAA